MNHEVMIHNCISIFLGTILVSTDTFILGSSNEIDEITDRKQMLHEEDSCVKKCIDSTISSNLFFEI